jgi:flagella basal body P-ring formation protein FlgA
MQFLLLFVMLLLVSFPNSYASGAEEDASQRIRIIGRQEIVVNTAQVQLSDLARVSAKHQFDNDALLRIRGIVVAQSPEPGDTLSISASQVLSRLREEGVDLKLVGYALPRVMSVRRASRALRKDELMPVFEQVLNAKGRDARIISLDYDNNAHVLPGDISLIARVRPGARPGQVTFDVEAKNVDGERPRNFSVSALIEEWRDVPVAARSLIRGSRVAKGDLAMARLNTAELPDDTAWETEQILGHAASRPISAGDVFRANALLIPPVVTSGSKVTMRYRSKLLEATASGTAMDDGISGQQIRIRNDATRKIVMAEVIEPGLVGVTQ